MELQDHWDDLGRRLARMGPPQVPGAALAAQVRAICDGCRGTTVLLGVTPAFADLGDRVLAFDASSGMIAQLWTGDDARRQARVADWTALPVGDGQADQVLGDGSLNAVPDRDILRAVLREIRRLLVPGGRAAVRVFSRPQPEETVADVLDAARGGRVESLNALRWHLASALATGPAHEVAVAEILAAVEPLGDLAAFAQTRGMDPAEAEHFQAYHGSSSGYVFPDRQALEQDAAQSGLTCTWVETSGYPGARDCPFAVLQARD